MQSICEYVYITENLDLALCQIKPILLLIIIAERQLSTLISREQFWNYLAETLFMEQMHFFVFIFLEAGLQKGCHSVEVGLLHALETQKQSISAPSWDKIPVYHICITYMHYAPPVYFPPLHISEENKINSKRRKKNVKGLQHLLLEEDVLHS